MARPTPCIYCGEDADYICERCLRCEKCDPDRDKKRELKDQHLNRWIWSRVSLKGTQLVGLAAAGHQKGDWD